MMSYLIDPCGTGRAGPVDDATIVLVGCGGTGGFLAEAVCRLLIGRRGSLHLVDPDRVEPRNVARQAFLYGICTAPPGRRSDWGPPPRSRSLW
jgi:hypothetical protein